MKKRIFVIGFMAIALVGTALEWREAFDRAVQLKGPNAPVYFARDYAHAVLATTATATVKLATIVHVLDIVSSHPTDLRAIGPELTAAERVIARQVALDWVAEVFADRRADLDAQEADLRGGLK